MVTRAQVRKPPRSGGGSGRTYGGTRLTQEQTSAIGLAGETLAYAWLCEHYPDVTPDSWVSGYRVARLGGHEGDDTLGFDFEIQRKSDRLLFEVKATITDDFEFNMGESEVRAASAARKGSYRIIFIRSILEPEDRELLHPPNPFEPGHAAAYAQLNQDSRSPSSRRSTPHKPRPERRCVDMAPVAVAVRKSLSTLRGGAEDRSCNPLGRIALHRRSDVPSRDLSSSRRCWSDSAGR